MLHCSKQWCCMWWLVNINIFSANILAIPLSLIKSGPSPLKFLTLSRLQFLSVVKLFLWQDVFFMALKKDNSMKNDSH